MRCPTCNSTVNVEVRRLDDKKYRVLLYCPNCGFYQEFILEKKKEKKDISEEKQVTIRPLDSIPSDAPRGVRYIFELSKQTEGAFIPVYFSYLHRDPPEYGCYVSADELIRLGFDAKLAQKLVMLLHKRGIERLYKFQEEAIGRILSGEDIIIVAQTAMGKTEAFLLPALQIASIHRDTKPSILAIYPTKALARDQFSKFRYYAEPLNLRVAVLDGDTPWKERRKILDNPPEILITNFDMIHFWLPRHRQRNGRIVRLFLSARMLIIDETHTYYGAFGTHVHYILKRLTRMIENRMGKLQFVLSSATIANPREFGELLIGRKIRVVIGQGRRSSLGVLFVYSYEPPFRAIARMLMELVNNHIKTLAFFNTRSSAELAYNVIKRTRKVSLYEKISIHRAGIPPNVRIAIEQKFKKDKLLGILSTPTLELGIDIGNVSSVISVLTPVDRFIQRSGRAGRREKPGSAILILRSDDPISDYYAMNPHEYFKDLSGRYLEPRNPFIAKKHIYLMAYEKTLKKDEIDKYGIPTDIVKDLEKERALFRTKDGWIANGIVFHKYFSRNIRGIDIQIAVFYRDKKIDEREILLALKELYPGAIYLNRGTKYIVRKLDLQRREATVDIAPTDYHDIYTKPLYSYSAIPIGELERKETCGTIVFHGPLRMRISVWGYMMFREGERKPLIQRTINPPIEYEYPTYGLFFKAPTYVNEDEDNIAGAYHATEHILIEGTYRISGGSEYDLGGISYGTSGLIVIHEALPGGNGVSSLLYERFEEAIKKSYELLDSQICRRKETLNKCVFSYHCGNNNQPLNQRGAREILERMLRNEKVPDADKAPELLEQFEKGIV